MTNGSLGPLGTILPEEHEQLRVFKHKYLAAYGVLARWYCAREVFRWSRSEPDVEQGHRDPLASQEIPGGDLGAEGNEEAENSTVTAEFSGAVAPFIGYPSSSEEYYNLHCAQPPNLLLQTN
ncbi:hypothetical protein CSOJ01_13114 [Colletotrichum sojae]|uniref:Uncharacterized protein n=1 Tax=Colletotrichum sojae TaxID=2175907 RepID=A0A8H6ITX6_9PEZI|nr:hypothetical protein CSOJ01_13114 [Colletotrichum sojae]